MDTVIKHQEGKQGEGRHHVSSQTQAGSSGMPECRHFCMPDLGIYGGAGVWGHPRPRLHICYPLSSDYAMRHIGQLFRSNYMFLFQLPWLPEKLLSMSDFQVR